MKKLLYGLLAAAVLVLSLAAVTSWAGTPGTLSWSSFIDAAYSSPAIGADGTIYVGSLDHNLYAINPDGTPKWTYATGSYIMGSLRHRSRWDHLCGIRRP